MAGFLLLTLSAKIEAASWALLPVKFHGDPREETMEGPKLNPDSPQVGWDIAQLIRLYLKANYVYNVLPMESVKKAYKKNGIGLDADLTTTELTSLSRDIDADKILLLEVFFSRTGVRVDSKIYFSSTELISDSIHTTGETLFATLGHTLKNRFQFAGNNFIAAPEKYYYIFGLDASGRNYNEIHALPNLLSEMDIDHSSAVAVDGYSKVFVMQPTTDKSALIDYVNHVKPQSTDTTDRLFSHLLGNVIEMLEKGNHPEETNIVILSVASSPKEISARQKVNGFMRRLASKAKVLILANGKLSLAERKYWSLMSASNSRIIFKDVLYKQKIGLSDGNTVYLLKSGDKLLESNLGEMYNAHEIFLNQDESNRFNQDSIVNIFETATQKKVVSPGKSAVSYDISIISDLIKTRTKNTTQATARILVLIEDKPFWIETPYKSIQDENGKIKLINGEKYYFFINLSNPGRGMPFKNSPDYAEILPVSEVSNTLLLNIDKYLKQPESYLGKSIGGTSLYIIYGMVKDITIAKKRVF